MNTSADKLQEIDREDAIAVVAHWLHRDTPYSTQLGDP